MLNQGVAACFSYPSLVHHELAAQECCRRLDSMCSKPAPAVVLLDACLGLSCKHSDVAQAILQCCWPWQAGPLLHCSYLTSRSRKGAVCSLQCNCVLYSTAIDHVCLRVFAGYHGGKEGTFKGRRRFKPDQQPRLWPERHACWPHHVRKQTAPILAAVQ